MVVVSLSKILESISTGTKQGETNQLLTSDEEEVSLNIKEVLSCLISLASLTDSGPKLASVYGVESLLGEINGLVGGIEILLNKEFPSLRKHSLECKKKANANDKCQNILMKMNEVSVMMHSPHGEDLSSGYGLGEESSNELEEGSGDEEEEFDTSNGEEQLHTLSSPSYSAVDCEKECDEVDDQEGGAASREVDASQSATPSPNVNSIVPQPLPGDTAVDVVGDEDLMNDLLLNEESLLASLHTTLQEGGHIVAAETQLNQVLQVALERIFDPQHPQYNRLPDLTNSFIRIFFCNDRANKALSLEHKALSVERSEDVIGLSEGMTWGAIAFKVAETTSDNDGRADLPEHITSLLEDARAAVSKFDNTMKLENFAKFGMNDKIRLGILVSLAMMQVVLSELTIRQLSSDSRAMLEWRNNVEELWKLVCPELEFNADVRLSDFFVAVVRPGLNSADEEIFELSSDVTHDTVKVLTLTKGTKAVSFRGAYKKSQSRTADGGRNESSVDYCAGDGELHSKARNRMVTIYILLFVLDVLMRKKLGQETTRKSLLHKLLITGQDQIRLAFNQSVFNMKQDLGENQLAKIRNLLEQKKRRKAIESRMLLIDSEEQITSMQNILAIAKPNHD